METGKQVGKKEERRKKRKEVKRKRRKEKGRRDEGRKRREIWLSVISLLPICHGCVKQIPLGRPHANEYTCMQNIA
jgi:hypothetical protein